MGQLLVKNEIGGRIARDLVRAGANVPYLALHLVSWLLDLSTLAQT